MKIVMILLSITSIVSCNNHESSGTELSIQDLGEIRFRRSFAGHENWSALELDSVTKMNPALDILDTTAIEAFNVLKTDGFIVDKSILIDKISETLRDTLLLTDSKKNLIAVTIGIDTNLQARTIKVSKGKKMFQLPFETYGIVQPRLKKLEMPDKSLQVVAFIPWYFMNGDMYTFKIFKLE